MPHMISVTQAPSLVVIQDAYEWLCATGSCAEAEAAYFPATLPYRFLFSPPPQTTLATEPPVEDWLKFQDLVEQWRCERGAMSSITEMVLCAAYQSIIGMGEKAIPFLLAQLELEGDEPDQWFWALRALTGTDPVRDEDRGNYVRMSQSWLRWWAKSKEQEYAR